LTTEVRVTELDAARAALERGRHVVLLIPPAPEQAGDLWTLLDALPPGARPGGRPGQPEAVIICADPAAATDWVAVAPTAWSVHPVTGLARTARQLALGVPGVLAGAAKDLAALVARSALKLDAVPTIIVAWPETLIAGEHGPTIDTLLGEAHAARRIVLTWNPALLEDFLERHAHRAPMIGTLPIGDDGRPLPPLGSARYAIVPAERRLAAIRDALDVLDPARALVWTPDEAHAERLRTLLGTREAPTDSESIAGSGSRDVSIGVETASEGFDLVICARLPRREQFAALSRHAPPVVLVTAAQLPYLRSLAQPLSALRLPSAADRARDRAEALLTRVAEVLGGGAAVDGELMVLAPLFERFDPAEVAAALLALQREGGRGKGEGPVAPPGDVTPGRGKVFVNVGKKDRVGPKDLVGALIKEVGLLKADIGRIEVRETFTLVEVAARAAERAVAGLSGVTIRGRRIMARLDRGAGGGRGSRER